MADEMKNIFISHIHEDDEGLGKLKSLLKDNGMTTRDYSINADNPNNAHSEEYIKAQILAPRIRQSSTLAVYISPETKDSKYVNWEIEYAQKQEKRNCGSLGAWRKRVRSPGSIARLRRRHSWLDGKPHHRRDKRKNHRLGKSGRHTTPATEDCTP